MAKTGIYPAAMKYLSDLSASITALKSQGVDLDGGALSAIASHLNGMTAQVQKLVGALAEHDFATVEAHMQHCANTLRPLMDEVRKYADALEVEIANEVWPFPTYQEMLFIK